MNFCSTLAHSSSPWEFGFQGHILFTQRGPNRRSCVYLLAYPRSRLKVNFLVIEHVVLNISVTQGEMIIWGKIN